ncbi:PQQ-dependent sugar dehydrogenase [Chryseobacterium lacus]|uniref:PQQ-dependent sugar dehydrogenase n=1 Tax=Chryseobacterium lacus TaxID=2058346 RepID=A0A368MYQ7_9FLAO|nr:PQQ-dependent sugar dehydrogenase [Chryseobacterium lacus]RCU43377.1 PQQ-dependent sugar dehydrogenase [Chryseobacterium lacus]RST28388.1 PQQ-dependent sugar dehydrogenase [Chryseobacterium lacus]
MNSAFKFLAVATLFLAGCQNNTKSQNGSSEAVGTALPNPESDKRNTDIPAAYEGQTRVKGVKTSVPYEAQVIASGLGKPWGIINLPDGRFLITEKSGSMIIVSKDGKTKLTVDGFPKVDDKGQGGLLDVALDPDFKNNRMIYWTFSEPVSNGNHTAVAKGKLSADEKSVENPVVIFRAVPTYDGDKHYGSRIIFDKDGNLFVTTGERSDMATRHLAQDQSGYLGKILKINKEGKAAAGNPNIPSWKPEIYATGIRNPQGIAFHPTTGALWQAEMGPKGGDEVNLIKPGINYGWPTITYGEEYSGKTIGEGIGQKDGLEQPVYFWDPSVSPSGIDFYTGNIAEWKNNLMIACLSGKKIIRLVIENDKVTGEEWLLEDENERFRDVLNGHDGNLYGITDSGKLYKVSPK